MWFNGKIHEANTNEDPMNPDKTRRVSCNYVQSNQLLYSYMCTGFHRRDWMLLDEGIYERPYFFANN